MVGRFEVVILLMLFDELFQTARFGFGLYVSIPTTLPKTVFCSQFYIR